MPINHKFLTVPVGGFPDLNFSTQNGILKTTSYKPEVMIIGTYNPSTPNANFGDFFYGRNYFWTGFKQLLYPNHQFQDDRRMPTNGQPGLQLDPTLGEILELCEKFKLTFSDLISRVLHNGDPEFRLLANDNVIYNGHEFNLIQDNRDKELLGLANLNNLGQVEWNTKNIISYLQENPQIKYIYLTRQAKGIWGKQWKLISNHPLLKDRSFKALVTPSGRGIKKLVSPFNSVLKTILHYWVWNGLPHPIHVNNPAYGHLDHIWLEQCGVNVNNF